MLLKGRTTMVKKQNRPTRVFTEGNRRNEGVLKQFKDNSTQALTLIEVLIVISVLFVLMVVFLLARPRATCCRINCMNNLKQIGLSFRTWAMDNKDQFPMQIGVTNGGTMELVNGGNVFPHFLVMSNELSTPKVLVCPEEKEGARQMANTFTMPANSAGAIPLTNDNNVSYFVGVDADESQPTVLLAGDRNLTFNGQAARHGLRLI